MKIKCKNCGYEQETEYKHDVCKKCFASIHTGKEMPSLYSAIANKDTKLIREIEKRAKSGQIVRLM